MQSYWKMINFQPETMDMNFDDSGNEEEASELLNVDQVSHQKAQASIDSEWLPVMEVLLLKVLRKKLS